MNSKMSSVDENKIVCLKVEVVEDDEQATPLSSVVEKAPKNVGDPIVCVKIEVVDEGEQIKTPKVVLRRLSDAYIKNACSPKIVAHGSKKPKMDAAHSTAYVGTRFTCAKCNKSVKTKSNLIRHFAICRDPIIFECGSCKQRFATGSLLQKHEKTHEIIRPSHFSLSYGLATTSKKFAKRKYLGL